MKQLLKKIVRTETGLKQLAKARGRRYPEPERGPVADDLGWCEDAVPLHNPRTARTGFSAALAVVGCFGTETAKAQSPYRLVLEIDLPLIGLGLAGTAINFVELPAPSCLPECSTRQINGLDRLVLGNYSETAHSVADALVLGLLGAAVVADLIDSGGDGYVEDLVVMGEAVVLTQAITQLTKVAVRRNAPFVYDPNLSVEQKSESKDASRAFWSGHTATAFSAASAFTTTFWLRNPNSAWRFVAIGLGAAIATSIALLKIEAGYHFWTDIVAGAVAGTSVGVLVPVVHQL